MIEIENIWLRSSGELLDQSEQVDAMASALEEYRGKDKEGKGVASDAYKETKRLFFFLQEAKAHIADAAKRLSSVWRAMEKELSGDGYHGQVEDALLQFRKEHPTPHDFFIEEQRKQAEERKKEALKRLSEIESGAFCTACGGTKRVIKHQVRAELARLQKEGKAGERRLVESDYEECPVCACAGAKGGERGEEQK